MIQEVDIEISCNMIIFSGVFVFIKKFSNGSILLLGQQATLNKVFLLFSCRSSTPTDSISLQLMLRSFLILNFYEYILKAHPIYNDFLFGVH